MAITKIRQTQVKNLVEDLAIIKEQIKTFKAPVDLIENLPIEGNNPGDLRVCLEDGNIYVWNETDSEWRLSSGKGGTYTKTITIEVGTDNQTEIQTGIRFDETGSLQTNNTNVNVFLNGLLVDVACYEVQNVLEQMIIKWKDAEMPLAQGDQISIQYYDILAAEGTVTGGSGSKVDLSSYSTTEQMNEAIQKAVSDLNISNYSTTVEMNEAIRQAVAGVDLSAYSTTEQMTQAITAEIQKIDLTKYVTSEALEAKGYAKVVRLSQSEYDLLEAKDQNTIYIVTE